MAPEIKPLVTERHICPQCGANVCHWWSATHGDPGDVDPRANCTNPTCEWGY